MEQKGTIREVDEPGRLKEYTTIKLARFTRETNFEDLPPEVVDESKRLLLDSLACALAGYGGEDTPKVTRFASWDSGRSSPRSTTLRYALPPSRRS